MLRPTDLLRFTRAQPFVPVRIHTTDGRAYDVRHPDMAIVTERFVDVGIAPASGDEVVDRIDRVALMHVVRVEPLARSATLDPTG